MSFRFPLATVLRYREELEKREQRLLEQRREALALLQKELERLRQARRQLIAERTASLQSGLLGDDLHYGEFYQQLSERYEEEIQQKITVAHAEYSYQMNVFLTARQKREILEKVRDARKTYYVEQQTRREQQNIDEMFSSRISKK